ncbi:MAK10-like protein [Tanacetum coccineum]
MGDENPICTLGDYSKPSHEGYRNTIELPVGINVVPLPSNTIRLVQNGCSFHGLRSEDPNQHLKDFLKLVDSLDLDGPSPQPQTLGTTFDARIQDYMAAHTERIERFKNTIFKQREEINGRMTKMFGLLKELTTSRTPEKVLIREEVKFPVTKNVNSISLTKGEEEGSNRTKVTPDNAENLTKTKMETPAMVVEKINEVENGAENKSIKTSESVDAEEAPDSQPITYYLKHKINKKLIKGLLEKWLTFSQELRNAKHTQTLNLADIYERFVDEDNLIQRRISKKILMMSQKANEDTECFKCGKKGHFAKDCLSKSSEPFYKSPVTGYSSKDYKAEYKKMKAKLALLEASPSTSQTPKTFQPKKKCLVAETFDWDEEEVSDDEEVTEVKVLIALADDELSVGKNHARNSEWIDITIRKVERLNPDNKLPNFNTRRILVPESQAVNESLKLIEASTDPESSKDSEAESLTPLPPLKILQEASPSLKVMSLTFQPRSLKGRSGLGIMRHIKPKTQDFSNKSVLGTVTVSETTLTTPSVPTEVKNNEQESKINELTKLIQMLIDEKVNSTQKTQESNSQIQQTESSKSVDLSKMSQDSKPKVQNSSSSKSLRPKPI